MTATPRPRTPAAAAADPRPLWSPRSTARRPRQLSKTGETSM